MENRKLDEAMRNIVNMYAEKNGQEAGRKLLAALDRETSAENKVVFASRALAFNWILV